jgi:hypothetical protein
MAAALLYLATVAVLLLLAHRFVCRLSGVAVVVLLLIPLSLTGRALLTGRIYGPFDLAYSTEPLNWMRAPIGLPPSPHSGWLSDVASQMIPWRAAVRDAVQHGQWPLWNRFLFGGSPLAGLAQPATYSPFTLLASVMTIGSGTTYFASIWIFLGALSAFLFARQLGCRETVALFAAAAWPLCTAPAVFLLWPLGESWMLLPLVLAATARVVAKPEFESSAFLMIALTLTILAGHPESVLQIVLFGSAYGLFLLTGKRSQIVRSIAFAAAAGVLAVLLTAIYSLPFEEALKQSDDYYQRKTFYAHWKTGASGTEALAKGAIDLLTWPFGRGWTTTTHLETGVTTSAAGSIVLTLAAFAVWRIRSRQTWFFAVAAAIFGITGADWQTATTFWKKLPLFDISFEAYFVFAAAFSLVALATIAIEFVCTRSQWRLLGVHFGVVTIVLTVASVLLLRSGLIGPVTEKWGELAFVAEITAPAMMTIILLLPLRAAVLSGALVASVVAQRTAQIGGLYPVFDAAVSYPPVPVFESLRNVRDPFRIVGQGLALIPGASTMYGLEDVRGYTAMTFAPYMKTWPLWCTPHTVWFNRVDDLEKPFLSFLNVRYAVTWSREREHPGWREIARQRGSKLLENTRVIPRAFIPQEIAIGRRDAELEMRFAGDFRKRAWIQTADAPYDIQNGSGTVTIKRRKLGYRLYADMKETGWIVVSEQRWSGWRASIDGERVPIEPANIAFLGIHVPRGSHVVDLRYWPQSFVIGRAISAATLLALIACAIWRVGRARWLAFTR